MNKTQEKALASKIKHIVGECGCPASSKTCAYWLHVDKGGDDWQTKMIIKEVKKLWK